MKFLKNNFIVKFVVTLFLVGIILGLLYNLAFKPDLGANLESFRELITSSHQNTFFSSIVAISMIFVLSISVIGLPVIAFYIFYEGMSIGFTLGAFIYFYHLKGALFYILFVLFSKVIYFAIFGYFTIISLRYIAKFLDTFIVKNREELYKTIVFHFYRFLCTLIAIIANSFLVYLLSNRILGLFIGLLS